MNVRRVAARGMSMLAVSAAVVLILPTAPIRADLIPGTGSVAKQAMERNPDSIDADQSVSFATTSELTERAIAPPSSATWILADPLRLTPNNGTPYYSQNSLTTLKTANSNYEHFIGPRFTDYGREVFPGVDVQDAAVPEPPLLLLLTSALVAIGWWGWRRVHGPRRSSGQRPHRAAMSRR